MDNQISEIVWDTKYAKEQGYKKTTYNLTKYEILKLASYEANNELSLIFQRAKLSDNEDETKTLVVFGYRIQQAAQVLVSSFLQNKVFPRVGLPKSPDICTLYDLEATHVIVYIPPHFCDYCKIRKGDIDLGAGRWICSYCPGNENVILKKEDSEIVDKIIKEAEAKKSAETLTDSASLEGQVVPPLSDQPSETPLNHSK